MWLLQNRSHLCQPDLGHMTDLLEALVEEEVALVVEEEMRDGKNTILLYLVKIFKEEDTLCEKGHVCVHNGSLIKIMHNGKIDLLWRNVPHYACQMIQDICFCWHQILLTVKVHV